MKLKTLSGRPCSVSHKPYVIDWSPAREVSKPQAAVKQFLRPYWERDLVLEEMPIRGGGRPMRLDLVNISKGIAVEVSPSSSHSFNKFFHNNSFATFQNALKRDMKKEDWVMRIMQWQYCEITDDDFPLTEKLFAERFGVIL